MTSRIIAMLIFSSICSRTFAQVQRTNIWYFGAHSGIDFRNGNAVSLFDGATDSFTAVATICDINSALLCYTDGVTVWNRLNLPMPNGNDLFGNQFTTQTLIVPQPENDSSLYIFTAPSNGKYHGINNIEDSVGFRYSVVNMNKANGLGDVVSKNVFLFRNTTEKITGILHANGRDVWVVAHESGNNNFRSYKITANGIDTTKTVISNSGEFHNNDPGNTVGQMKISPDGNKLALAIALQGMQFFDFDNTTGTVSNPSPLIINPGCSGTYWGIEFSPDSKYLYYTTSDDCTLNASVRCYDVNSRKPYSTLVTVNAANYYSMQLAPDGKIYLCGGSTLSGSMFSPVEVIGRPNHPDNPDYRTSVIETNQSGTAQDFHGFPNFIESYFRFPDPVVEMPDFFSPNGDNYNETFAPFQFSNVLTGLLTIVDRWGDQVYRTEDVNTGWNGGDCTVGIYYWQLDYEGKNGGSGRQRGWVRLSK